MAGNFSFTAFLKEMGVDLSEKVLQNKDELESEKLKKLHEEFLLLTETMDDLTKSVTKSKKSLERFHAEPKKPENAKVDKIREDILTKELADKKKNLADLELKTADFVKKSAAQNRIDPTKLDAQLRGFNSYKAALTGGGTQFSKLSGITNSFFKGFSGSVGGVIGKIGGILGKVTNPIGLLTAAAEIAGAQVVELNDKLIQFTRDTNGVFSPESIGYDKYGNSSNTGRASLDQQAGMAGVDVTQILQTYNAFKQGSGVIGNADLQNNPDELQKYGVQVAKMNKMYGVSSEVSGKVATVLTQQYGKSVKEVGDIMQKGARTAREAGLNVGIFFDNMQAIASLKGTLFVRGGADGIEKAALALTKLGLAADKLTKLQDSYTSFNDLIDKQQKAVAMGFNNLASVQSKIFAKLQTGDTRGALELKQIAGAKDVAQFTNKEGNVNQQGINALKSQGYDAEEIASIERVIKSSNQLGISIDKIVSRNNLTIEQQEKLNKYDQEQLTVKEKLNKMWASIKAVVVDPIAAVIAPIFDALIDTVGFIFDTIATIMKPTIAITKGIGAIIGAVWGIVKKVVSGIGRLFGFGKDKDGNEKESPWTKVANVIGKVFDVVVKVLDWIGDVLGGIFDVLGDFLSPIFEAISSIWDAVIKYIWEPLKSLWSSFENVGKWLRKAWYALPFTGDNPDDKKKGIKLESGKFKSEKAQTLFDNFSAMSPLTKLIAKSNEWLFKIYDNAVDTDDEQVKISSIPSIANEIPEVAKIMQAKTINTTLNEQSEKETMVNTQTKPQVSVTVKTDPHVLGGVKAMISG